MARAEVRRRLSWQPAQVLEVRPETARASRLTLRVPDWQGHDPGQHLVVRLTAPDGYTAQRSYSIASPPKRPDVEIVVETLPDGEVSPYLTGEVQPGDELEVRGPVGGYFVWAGGDDDPGTPLQLIAGGSGVVPFLAMLEHHAAVGSEVPMRLLYSVRRLDDVIARGLLAVPPVGTQVAFALTRQAPEGWSGVRGRLDRAALQSVVFGPELSPRVFVCGPSGFVETVAEALVDLGHAIEHIRTERFGASGGA